MGVQGEREEGMGREKGEEGEQGEGVRSGECGNFTYMPEKGLV